MINPFGTFNSNWSEFGPSPIHREVCNMSELDLTNVDTTQVKSGLGCHVNHSDDKIGSFLIC